MADTPYRPDILDLFLASVERDRKSHLRKWMVRWAYQDRKSKGYAAGFPQNFYSYDGPNELPLWFSWMSSTPRPSFVDESILRPRIEASRRKDQQLFEILGLNFEWEQYDATIGTVNAQDIYFPQCYPTPERQTVHRVIDFGAGYGRQANLWMQQDPSLIYVGVDGIPLSYCLQHLYYSHLGVRFSDYVVEPDRFNLRVVDPGVYHLPTWRLDLIPSDSFDLISCVQVLPELGRHVLMYTLRHAHRILKPGGALYIRDHDRTWRPGHGINTSRVLSKLGFELEFHPQVIDREEVWGIPRVWRKEHPDVAQSRQRSARGVVRDWIAVADGWTGGRLRQYARRLRQMS